MDDNPAWIILWVWFTAKSNLGSKYSFGYIMPVPVSRQKHIEGCFKKKLPPYFLYRRIWLYLLMDDCNFGYTTKFEETHTLGVYYCYNAELLYALKS